MNINQLVESFKAADDLAKWEVPFPMGVFGTLRAGWGNHPLMGTKVGAKPSKLNKTNRWYRPWSKAQYCQHFKAFMPHFTASGLTIHFSPDSSAVFEVYVYDPDNWKQMIPSVERLEGFSPGRESRGYGYHRTLTWLHLLPSNFSSPFFSESFGGRSDRDLQLPVADWKNYPKLPCWVYSSLEENQRSFEGKKSPIIWDGVLFDKVRI